MTGYTADMQSMIRDKDGSLIPMNDIQPVVYVIHDGARLGSDKKNDTLFTVPWSNVMSRLNGCNNYRCDSWQASLNENGTINFEQDYSSSVTSSPGKPIDLKRKWLWAISDYVCRYGFLGTSTITNTTFNEPSDDSDVTIIKHFDPPLNISAHFILLSTHDTFDYDYSISGWNICPSGRGWQNPLQDKQLTFNQSRPLLWDAKIEKSYTDPKEFNKAGSCQQPGVVKYHWGFSFLLLYVFIATFCVWIIGMWALYMDSWLHSRLDISRRHMSPERALLDISETIFSAVEMDEVRLYGNAQIQGLVEPVRLTYSDLLIDSKTVTRWTEYQRW